MNQSQNTAHQLVHALLQDAPQAICDDLALRFALCVHHAESNDSHELLTVDTQRLVAASRKSTNAFLDIPRFLRTVGELAVEGTTLYQVPFLFVPIALRMMRIGKNAVTRQLGQPSTALLLALHESPALGSDIPNLNARAGEILQKAGMTSADTDTLRRALKDLLQLRCVKQTSDGGIQLSETVELHGAISEGM